MILVRLLKTVGPKLAEFLVDCVELDRYAKMEMNDMRQCIAPQEIKEGDLSAYLDEQAPPHVAAHVANCLYCQAEIANLLGTELLLDEVLYLEDCPDDVQMLHYVAGFLAGEVLENVAAHVASCPDCAQEYRALTAVSPQQQPAPPSFTSRLQEAGERLLQAVRLPGAPQLGMAMRGQQDMGEIYEASDYQIILGSKPAAFAPQIYLLEGQVIHTETGMPLEAVAITLLQEDKTVTTGETNMLGYFQLERLSSGSYTLEILIESDRIVIKNLSV